MTSPTAETAIADAMRKFGDELTASFALDIPGQPEDQLKAPVASLLATLGKALQRILIHRSRQ